MKNIKIIVATHKKYSMPSDDIYLPIHVGKEKNDLILEYKGDNEGHNISLKNPYYCELTGLYWAYKNLNCDYIGLVQYRRHFSNKSFLYRLKNKKENSILTASEVDGMLDDYNIIVPKKRRYYIETLYSHYGNTHYKEHLNMTREIIRNNFPSYIQNFDKVMNQRSGYMFNMFIMKKEYVDEYCDWLFTVLLELEKVVDINKYTPYQARIFGRVSELLFNVWLLNKREKYLEIPHMYMEKINWLNKGGNFLKAKFFKNIKK